MEPHRFYRPKNLNFFKTKNLFRLGFLRVARLGRRGGGGGGECPRPITLKLLMIMK